MRTLVLGANGLLGSNVVADALERGWDVRGTVRSDPAGVADSAGTTASAPLSRLDVRDADRAAAVLDEHAPDVVVNCAAMTDVDGCEREPDRAHAVNGEAPGFIAATCADRGIPFVHVSTDYVFDGRVDERYDESAAPNPIQVYGESKLAGERAVQNAVGERAGENAAAEGEDATGEDENAADEGESLLVRLSFVYGTHGFTGELTGFPAWVRDTLAAGESVPLFTDQRVTPSRAGQAAECLLDLVEKDARGTYHVASRSCVTPHEFGCSLAERMDVSPALVDEGSMADVEREAARPQYCCLDVSRVEETLDRVQPTVDEDLATIEDVLTVSAVESGHSGGSTGA